MKIFIDLIRDQSTYVQDVKTSFDNMGWEVTSDVNDNFDDGIALVASDHVVVMSSLADRHLPPIESHDLCDKWILYNFLKERDMPTIATCFPKTLQEVEDFFAQYGSFIVKPRVGGGGWGPYSIHYNKFNSVEEFIEESSIIANFWETQNSTEYRLPIPIRQCILQQYIETTGTYTEQVRFKCDINDKSEFFYQVTANVKKKVVNTSINTFASKIIDLENEIYTRLPNDVEYTDPEIESIIRKFIDHSNLKSCYISFECLIIDGAYYINDTTISPPVIRSSFSEIDNYNYQESAIRYHYGLTNEIPRNFSRYYMMAIFPVKGGMTRERLEAIENNNVQKLWNTYTGADKVWLIIRGNTLEEYSATKQTLIEYLDSLT